MKKTMKKTILVSALLLMIGISGTFAADGVSDKIMNSFKKEFTNAQDVDWQIGKEYVKATFNINGQVMFAYYSDNGNQLGIARNMISTNLPLSLNRELKYYLSQSWITELFEINSSGQTSFYVTVENADYNMVLKSTDLNGWEVYSKRHKD